MSKILIFFFFLSFLLPKFQFSQSKMLNIFILCTAAIGASYPTLTCTLANMRGKDDVINHAAAGFMSGSIYGIRCKYYNYAVLIFIILYIGCEQIFAG